MEFCHKVSRLVLFVLQEVLYKLKSTLINIIQRQSLESKILINLVFVLVYGYLLATSSEWSGDHVEISCIHILTFLPTLRFLLSLYAKYFLALFFRLLSLYGWIRITLYSVFLLMFSYMFVAVLLDNSALMCMSKAKELFLTRYENTAMFIEEDRLYFEQLKPHPLSAGENSPVAIEHLIRYPMEDAQMNCTTYINGFYGGRPFMNQVEWRRNGVPLNASTDRYSVVTSFQELPHDHVFVNKDMKRFNLAMYELRSTLSVYLLGEADFGSYTCHCLDKVHIPVTEFEAKTGKKVDPSNTYFRFKQNSNNAKQTPKKGRPQCQCTCSPERQYFFQDVHTQIQEFRVIRMKDKHDQLEAPVTSILFFSTNYLHLSAREDVQSDYTVNGVSVENLCSDDTRFAVRGCSALQRLLVYFMGDYSFVWWFNILPVSFGNKMDVKGAHLTSGHCLCENSFGRHNMKFTRTYYNRTSGKYEMFEIIHPHTLLVRPPRQNSSNFFANIWKQGSMKLLPLTDYLPEIAYDLTVLKDLAVVSGIILNAMDAFFIGLGFVAFSMALFLVKPLFRVIGQVSRKCFLEGSMGYLCTAVLKLRSLQEDQTKRAECLGNDNFDIFLSHSDSEMDMQIVSGCVVPLLEGQLHFSVFLRHRDLPPNELELKNLSQAIENSQRFIIFLSKDFLQEPFHETEAAIILETGWDRRPKPGVLVIKLDNSNVPVHWKDFTVHDWTSGNLSVEDHQLRLVQWLASQTQKAKHQWSSVDLFMVCVPFVLLSVVISVLFSALYYYYYY